MTYRLTLELRRVMRDSHDNCSVCGRRLVEGDTAHAGFQADGEPVYVGDCCLSRVVETAARYRWEPAPYDAAPADALIWRYVDLAKFVAVLKDNALYFPRADKLADRFEGAKGLVENKAQWDAFYLQYFRDALSSLPIGGAQPRRAYSPEEIEIRAAEMLVEFNSQSGDSTKCMYVSCWHENDGESEALWRLYCPPPTTGVAIVSTKRRLELALGDEPEIQIGRVRYIDFKTSFAGPNDWMFRKRRSLKHESELRALVRDGNGPEHGKLMPINLDVLVERIVVSPFVSDWFLDVLREIGAKFGFSAMEIRQSELLAEPFV